MNTRRCTLSILVALSTLTVGRAAFVDLEAQWSGADFGNSATATATFSLDLSLVNNPGSTMFALTGPTSGIQNFALTVSGSTSGNGAFDASNFSLFFFNTGGGTLDFNSNLVGQSTPTGSWGFGMPSIGDFNLFSNGSNPLAPTGSSAFTLSSGGEFMRLVSLSPSAPAAPVAVPETSTWVMGILAVGFVAISFFRSRSARLAVAQK